MGKVATKNSNARKPKVGTKPIVPQKLAPAAHTRNKSTQEIADLLDLDQSTILNWVKQGLPCDQPKTKREGLKFDESEVAAWMKKTNRTGKVGRPAEESSEELKALKVVKERLLVRKYEREERQAEGKLIDAAVEEQRDIRNIVAVRNRLTGLGAAIAPQLEGLDGAARQTVIDESVDAILQEFGSKT